MQQNPTMEKEEINYNGILWPLPYRIEALHRTKQLKKHHQGLAELYQQIFTPENLRLPIIPVPIPFSRQLNDHADAARYFAYRSDVPLTIVTVTRNDDHVERMAERTQAFIDCIYYLAEKLQRNVELIIVEWNPPGERPSLSAAFHFPEHHPFVSTVIVTVPEQLHQTFSLADRLPLYQMIGKNVGIRRARGEFILATNIDVLLSEELFDRITSPSLKQGHIYRSNRWDVNRNILDLGLPRAMIDNARNLTFQINYPQATLPRGIDPSPETPLLDHAGFRQLPTLHTMACGDFQLLHRNDWAKVRGYSELDTFSFHLDSLFAITCHFADINEINLSNEFPHYHIDHTLGTSVKNDSYVVENNKVMKHISLAGLVNLSRNMEEEGDYYIFNKPNWGMAGIELPANQVSLARWEERNHTLGKLTLDTGKSCLDQIELQTINIDAQQIRNQHALLTAIISKTANHIKHHCRDREILIWGTGHKARVFSRFLAEEGIPISHFIESLNVDKIVKAYDIPIIDIKTLSNRTKVFILICSMHAEKIVAQLKSINLEEGSDYLIAF